MNTRLTLPTPARPSPRFVRAAFSPIRVTRGSASTAPVFRAPPLDGLDVTRADWPAWHRGPLDRLQPILTRYRD